MNTRCVDCGGAIVYGEPHRLRVHSGGVTRVETRCRECAERLAWVCWPEEDFGPCPHPPRRTAGRA
jgi:hypothetical protein